MSGVSLPREVLEALAKALDHVPRPSLEAMSEALEERLRVNSEERTEIIRLIRVVKEHLEAMTPVSGSAAQAFRNASEVLGKIGTGKG